MAEEEQAFPKQHENDMPAHESEMAPEPVYEDESWKPRGDLAGISALITGGDSGIGRAVAVLFAKEGADIAIVYLDEHEDAEVTAARVRELGRECLLIPGDLADPAHCADVAAQVRERFGKLGVLVNNASVQYETEEYAKTPTDEIRWTLESNLLSALVLTRECLPFMADDSAIIQSTSVTAFRGSDHLIPYASTKGGLLAFTRSLASQLVTKGIRVNAVAPGPVWTPLITGSFPPEKVAEFGKNSPMGRAAQPYEIAPSYLFLACPRYSSFIAGQVIHPNGGEIVNA